jgi:hypothetical protein
MIALELMTGASLILVKETDDAEAADEIIPSLTVSE